MDGAFYAYCDVSRYTNDSMDFARRMIAQAHVAATPGVDFDPVEGHRTMRFSYAGATDDMGPAIVCYRDDLVENDDHIEEVDDFVGRWSIGALFCRKGAQCDKARKLFARRSDALSPPSQGEGPPLLNFF